MKRVLLISYYFDPFPKVGAKRMSYWAQAFFNEKHLFHCDVVTATPQTGKKENVFFLEDRREGLVTKFIAGYSWIPALKDFLKKSTPYDYVIISGGPFGHFGIAGFIKRNFSTRVILDFRDPLTGNSRFKDSGAYKEFIKRRFERSVLKHADQVITVNEYCRNLIAQNTDRSKIAIIENGYNERVVDNVKASPFHDDRVHFVYAGSFYHDGSPNNFVEQISKRGDSKFVMHHIGVPSPLLKPFQGNPCLIQYGETSYEDTIAIMKRCTTGLIITGGEPMESTTKVYDYIGCGLDILVVTNGTPQTGCINDVTSKLGEKVSWVKNTPSGINAFLENYSVNTQGFEEANHFSRYWGYRQLKELLVK